jgi:hypothetical protein
MNVGGPAIQITTLQNGLSNELIDQQLYFGSCPLGEIELIKDIRDQKRLHKIPGFSRRVSFQKDFNVLFSL